MSYWLLKTESDEWGWQHQAANGGLSHWDGVRNLAAQKNMRSMQKGDLCFFYHTGKEKAIVGVCCVTKEFYPEQKKADEENKDNDKVWNQVDVREVVQLPKIVTLKQLKDADGTLISDFVLLRQQRLSVVPVGLKNWEAVCQMGALDPCPKAPWLEGQQLFPEWVVALETSRQKALEEAAKPKPKPKSQKAANREEGITGQSTEMSRTGVKAPGTKRGRAPQGSPVEEGAVVEGNAKQKVRAPNKSAQRVEQGVTAATVDLGIERRRTGRQTRAMARLPEAE